LVEWRGRYRRKVEPMLSRNDGRPAQPDGPADRSGRIDLAERANRPP
jgi:hypothetical protein